MTHDRFVYASTPTPSRILSKLSFLFTMTTLMLLALVGMTPQASAQSCTGLCLQQITCPAGGTTSISGKVYAPNGTDVLPGVLVYIPNAAVQPFASGAQCLIAGQPASGSPLISTVTAADGTFTLTNAPVGSNIPLVIQAGKWRRQFVIPTVSSCSNTALPATGASQIRFPRTKAEGDIPQIAIVTGAVDSLECVMRKIGVADTEFTIQGAGGRINFYTGAAGPGATFQSGTTPSETVLESSAANLAANDLVMLGCQGEPYTPAPGALNSMQSYANAGGRIYATHYSYDFLTSTFPNVAQWDVEQNPEPVDQTAYIDQTFPKGVELATWLQNVGGSTTFGQLPVQVIRKDQDGVNAPTQSFLSIKNPAESIQFTFNTPVAAPPAAQCGRVLFNEYHVENATDNTGLKFPNECPALGTPLTPQEKLLEFSIFDLSTFVSPDIPPAASVTFTNQAAPVVQGDSADTVVVTVTNTSTTDPANPSLTATVQLPAGLTATAIGPQNAATSGWTCNLANLTCTRSTGLSAGASDAILVTFSVSLSAPAAETITATAAGGGLAANVSNTDSFPVQIVPTITWLTPTPITYGTALSSAQLNAVATYNSNTVPGTFTYTPTTGVVPVAGNQTLSVLFTPTDGTTYTTATASVLLTVNVAPLTVTAGSYSGTYDGNTHALSACAVSSNPDGLTCANNPAGPVGPGVTSGTVTPVVSGPTANYSVTTNNGVYSIGQAPSTVTLSCPTSVSYTGAAQTPCTAMVTGVGGLSTSLTVNYLANVNVGTATASANYSGDANHATSTNSVTFAITPIALTATAGSYSGTYDGNAHPLSACAVSANSDGLTCTNNPAGPVGPDASSATVTPVLSGSTANYTVTMNNGSYVIAPLSVTVTAGSYNGTYDGNAHPVSACSSTYAGVSCADNPATVGPNSTSGSVSPVSSVVSGVAADYQINSVGNTWQINPAPTTLTLTCPPSVTYSGASQMPCSATATGVNGFTGTAAIIYSQNVNVGTATATSTFYGNLNYGVSHASTTFAISAAPLTVTAGSYSGTYDGSTHALSACAVSSNPDGLSCTNNPVGPVGPGVGSGTVSPVLSGSSGNYSVTANNGAYAITAATSLVTVTCPASVTYSGSQQTPCTATVTGTGGLSASLTVTYTTNTSVGMAHATASYAGDANHAASSGSATFNITAAPLTMTAGSYSGTYDGNAHPLSACVVSANPDGLTCTNNPPGPVGPGVGSGTVTAVLSGSSANYSVIANSGAYAITAATSSVTVTCPVSVTYTGSAQTPCTATVTGTGLSAAASVSYTANVNAGVAHAMASYAGDANHAGSSGSATFNITAEALTATAGSYSGTYDGATHALSSCVVSGAVSGVTCTNNPVGPVGPGVGSGTVTPVLSGSSSNFSVMLANGAYSITITGSTVTLTCPTSVAYNGSAQTPCTAKATGAGGLNASVTVTYTNNTSAGVAHATATYAGDANHSGSSGSSTFTITQAAPVISWATPAAITYGTALSATQLNATVAGVAGTSVYNPKAGAVLTAGMQTLSVAFTPTDTTDYAGAMGSVMLTVNKAATSTSLAVTTTQTAAGTTATLSATVAPQISGTPTGTVTYMNGTTVLGSAAVGTSFTTGVLPVGANSISATYSGDSNFITSTSAKTTVTGVLPTTIQLVVPLPIVLYPLPVAYSVIVPLKNFQLISGTITIYDGTTLIATLPLLPGGIDVGLTLPSLKPGTHLLKAVYSGDSHYPAGQSPVITVTVL